MIEGDGTIIVPKDDKKSPSGSLRYGYFSLCFAMKDLPLAYYFQSLLGGHIHLKTNSCTLTFKSKKSVLAVIGLINGYMRTPKIEALHRLINWFNLKHNTQIIALGLDETPLQHNSWLSGFWTLMGDFVFTGN